MARHLATAPAHPWRRAARTVLQAALALAVMLPIIANTVGLDPALYPWVGAILAAAAAFARVMALPQVEAFLRRFVPWLAADDADAEDLLHAELVVKHLRETTVPASDVVVQVAPEPAVHVIAGPASNLPDGTPVTVQRVG